MTKSQRNESAADEAVNNNSQEALQQLLSRVDARQSAPEQVKQRIKHNVKTQWRASVTRNTNSRQLWWAWGSAATACSVAMAFWLNSVFLPAQVILNNLHLHRIQGQVKLVSAEGVETPIEIPDTSTRMTGGSSIETSGNGLVTLTFNSGGNLRLSTGTRVQFNGGNDLTLQRGTLYFDSGTSLNSRTKITVHTSYGEISNLGTQFAVSTEQEQLHIWVREGQVNVQHKTGTRTLEKGQQLLTDSQGKLKVSSVKSTDPVWQWVNELAPEFALEGQNLNQFLVWITREHGLKLEYDSLETKNIAHVIILHGELDDLNLAQSLETVFATVDLHYVLQQDKLLVYR